MLHYDVSYHFMSLSNVTLAFEPQNTVAHEVSIVEHVNARITIVRFFILSMISSLCYGNS